jgi:hypothetical protein
MNGYIHSQAAVWCSGGLELVRLLRDTFGKDNVLVRSPHHIQVEQERALHNVWIDSLNLVKYKLADQAGRAQIASTPEQLLQAISGHDHDSSDLANMRQALELSKLIDSAKAALPLCGVSRAVFVDAGSKDGQAQIGVVQVAIEPDGEHVRAESHPCAATGSNAAEQAAIQYAASWAGPDIFIFSDNRAAVERARKEHGDRVRWLPREQNRVADRVANLRGSKKKKRRRKRNRRAKKK